VPAGGIAGPADGAAGRAAGGAAPSDSRSAGPEAGPVPWRPIWLVGLGLVVFYMVDTTAAAWGPVYLARSFDAPGNLVALATFPYLVTSIVVRLAGGHLVTRFGVAPVLRVGAVLACAALALVALAPTWQVAVAGFTLLGASVALVAPLSFSAAGRIAATSTAGTTALAPEAERARTDAVIARFNQFNYAGALLGSVLTGLIGADNLRLGFALPAVLVLALVPLATAFARGTLNRR
jgi:MFS family permease